MGKIKTIGKTSGLLSPEKGHYKLTLSKRALKI